jgi:hypothetical protein
MLIQWKFFTRIAAQPIPSPKPLFFLSSLALRLLLRRHAVPLAEQRKKIQHQDTCVYCTSRGRSLDARLRCRKCVIAATTSTSAFSNDTGHCKSNDRIGCAWEPSDVHSHRHKYNGHCRQLEHQRSAGRKCNAGNDHFRGRIHRTCGHAVSRHRASHRDKPCRFHKIEHGRVGDHERHRSKPCPDSRKRGTRRDAGFPNHNNKQRASGYHSTLEPFWFVLRQRMRHCRRERELHRAADSSLPCDRDAYGTKRSGPFEADFHGSGHHQQFFITTLRAIQRAGWRHGNDCRDDDSRSRFEPKHGALMGAKRSRL